MDKILQAKPWYRRPKLWLLGGGLLGISVLYGTVLQPGPARQRVPLAQVTLTAVKSGEFQQFITFDGIVQPLRSIELTAVVGGQVKQRHVEEGAIVHAGDPILTLGNPDVLLDFTNRETALLDQLNNLRNTRITLLQNHYLLQQQLLDAEKEAHLRERVWKTNESLGPSGVITQQAYEESRDEAEHSRRRLELLRSRFRQDSTFLAYQLSQLDASAQLLNRNLELVKEGVENLVVRAPVDGLLSRLTAELGQNKTRGENVGQLDVREGFKLRAEVDQHYLPSVNPGLAGEFTLEGKTYPLRLVRVLPQVTAGRFTVEFAFEPPLAPDLRQGQTLQVRLTLGQPGQALLLPKGGFFQHTGGNWVFVAQEGKAVRRPVRLGRQNPEYYEVLEGLKPGEQVVTSSYAGFEEAEELLLE